MPVYSVSTMTVILCCTTRDKWSGPPTLPGYLRQFITRYFIFFCFGINYTEILLDSKRFGFSCLVLKESLFLREVSLPGRRRRAGLFFISGISCLYSLFEVVSVKVSSVHNSAWSSSGSHSAGWLHVVLEWLAHHYLRWCFSQLRNRHFWFGWCSNKRGLIRKKAETNF